jgi:hypothetical protein
MSFFMSFFMVVIPPRFLYIKSGCNAKKKAELEKSRFALRGYAFFIGAGALRCQLQDGSMASFKTSGFSGCHAGVFAAATA